MPILISNWSLAVQQLQKSSTQCTIYIGYPHIQYSVIIGYRYLLTIHLVLESLSIVKKQLQTLPLTVLYIGGELLLFIGCFTWLLSVLLPPFSITAFIQYLPISRCIQQISTYVGDLLASITVAALYRRGAKFPLSVVVVPIFPVLSLLLVDVVLPSLYTQAYYLFSKASLFVYILILSICLSLLGVLVLWLLFTLPLYLYRCQVVVLLLCVLLQYIVFTYRFL